MRATSAGALSKGEGNMCAFVHRYATATIARPDLFVRVIYCVPKKLRIINIRVLKGCKIIEIQFKP